MGPAAERARSPLRLLGDAVALTLVVATGTRLVLLGMHLVGARDPVRAVLGALWAGAREDVGVALWLCLPLVLLLILTPSARRAGAGFRRLVGASGVAAVFVLLTVAVAEVLFFAEFDGRFNFVAVDYLIYPAEVTTSLGESYPLAAIFGGIAAATGVAALLLRRRLHVVGTPMSGRARIAGLAGYGILLALATVGLPARSVSSDRALNEVARNGWYAFWEALVGVDAPYEGLYASAPHAQVLDRLHRLLREPANQGRPFDSDDVDRRVRALGPVRPLNVVVVLEESFGSDFVGALHGGKGLTPHFDSLVPQGTLLTHAYSTGNRTIRALEAVTASVPPLPGVSIVRRPASWDLRTLPGTLRAGGYATTFVYGGRALFDGMGDYLRRNGVERVIEERDFPADAFRTAWGVADEYIFDRTLAELDSLDATGRPSFTLVLTVSNHRPYTYPSGRIPQDPARKRRSHAVHYADWALGRFMAEARRHRFADHTLFVLMGDHGARVYGSAEIPLHSYEVPILFIAPGAIPAGKRVSTIASSLDVPPTVLGVLGAEYESSFFGRDLLRLPPDSGRALLTHNSDLALLEGRRMAVLGLHGATQVFEVTDSASLRPQAVGGGSKLVGDAIAYFDGADMLYRSGDLRTPRR